MKKQQEKKEEEVPSFILEQLDERVADVEEGRVHTIKEAKKRVFGEVAFKVRGAIAEFDDEHNITDIILLGKDGAVRRIQFEVEV